jgi:tetratricopeptide (TPR) repeat protein
MRHIVALFKAVDPSKLSDPGDQLKKVLEFKRDLEISKKILFKTFDETSEFQKTLRSHLANWVREHEQERGEPKRISEVAPSGSSLSAIDAVQLSEDPIANPLVKKAENLARQGRLTDAEVAFAKAIATGDDPDACNRYGVFLHRMGRLKQAELMYERVLNLGGRGSPKWKAIGYSNLGRVYAERGELDRAVDMHRRSLTLEKRLGRDKGIVLSHINIGVTFLTRSDEEQAARWLNKALKLARGKNYEEGVAYALLNLAAVDIERKDFPRAQQRLKEVISLAKRLGDPDLSPSALAALAEVSFHENKHQEAEALLRRALKIGEKSGDQEALAHVHWLFGKIHLSRNDIEGAGHSLDLALEIADRLGSPDIIAGILVDISRFYHEQKKDDFARAAVMKALQYYGVLGDRKKTDELKPWLDKLTAAVLAPGAPKES